MDLHGGIKTAPLSASVAYEVVCLISGQCSVYRCSPLVARNFYMVFCLVLKSDCAKSAQVFAKTKYGETEELIHHLSINGTVSTKDGAFMELLNVILFVILESC